VITRIKLSGQHATKFFISTELKTRVAAVAEALDRNFADTCRQLIWMGLPVIEGMLEAHERGSRWWMDGTVHRGVLKGTEDRET
jgi:hypothetical protein